MVIKLDYRESKLIEAMSSTCSPVVENMLLGDASIHFDLDINENDGTRESECDPQQPSMIIERKPVPDMIASLKDGRYMEQKSRLDASPVPNHNILFIIEGSRTGVPHIHAAVFSLFYHSGFGVLFSTNVSDTARIIVAFDRKLNKDPARIAYYSDSVSQRPPQTPSTYAAFLKPEKKANVCRENAWIIMLQQIPFVSSTIASALMEQFATVPNLVDALRDNPATLDGFKIYGGDGKSRKLSSRVVKTITELLV